MARKILPLLVIAVLAAVAWSFFGADVRPQLAGDTLPGAETGAQAGERSADAGTPRPFEGAQPATGQTERTEVATEEATARKDTVPIRARVVRKEDGTPVAGAIVRYLDPNMDWSTLTPQQRKKWREVAHDQELQYTSFGGKTIADDEGWVTIPSAKGSTQCCARKGELYGHAGLNTRNIAPAGGYRIEVEPDLTMRVRVVDANGKPVAGVGVAFRTETHYPGMPNPFPQMTPVGHSTAPDGLLVIRHLQARSKGWTSGNRPKSVRLQTDVAGQDREAGVVIDPAKLPEETVELVVPPHGSITVRVNDVDRKPFTDNASVALTEIEPSNGQSKAGMQFFGWGNSTHEPLVDGVAVFGHVALGKRFKVQSWIRQETVSETIDGPTRHGQDVPVELRLANEGHLVTGLAVGEDGEPLRNYHLQGTVRSVDKKVHESARGKTDEEGRFRMFLSKRIGGVNLGPMQLTASESQHRRGGSDTAETGALGTVPAGGYDVGKVVFTRATLIAAGVVLDEKGVPIEGAYGYVQQRAVTQRDGKQIESFNHVNTSNLKTDADGRFEIRGKVAPGSYRLSIQATGFVKSAPVDFTVGADDLEVRLRKGGSLRVTILVDPGIMSRSLRVELRAPAAADDEAKKGKPGELIESKEGSFAYQWLGVEPGVYEIHVFAKTFDKPLLPPPAVQLTGEEAVRKELDLRGKLRTINLTLFDPSGQKLEGNPGGGVFIKPEQPADDLIGVRMAKGVATVVTPSSFINVLVMIRGYLPQSLDGLERDTEIRLTGPMEVQLAVSNASAVPDGYSISLRVQPKDLGPMFARRYRMGGPGGVSFDMGYGGLAEQHQEFLLDASSWGFGGGRSELSGLAIKQSQITLKDGKGSFFTSAAGKFTVSASIRMTGKSQRRSRRRSTSVKVDPGVFTVIEGAGQTVQISLDKTSLAAALAKLEKVESATRKPR